MKKILFVIITLVFLTCLCGCKTDNDNTESKGEIIPEAVGTWYPHPEVSDGVIELRADGTCTVFENDGEWSVVSKNDNEVVLSANSCELIFTVFDSGITTLFENGCGYMMSDALLWKCDGEWHGSETNNVFAIDMLSLENESFYSKVELESEKVYINVFARDDDNEPYYRLTLELDSNGEPTMLVNCVRESREELFRVLGGSSGGDQDISGIDKLLEQFNDVLEGKDIINIDTDKTIEGSEAVEYIYRKLKEYEYHDVARDILERIEVKKDVLVGKQDTSITQYPFMGFDYNAFGNPMSQMVYASFDKLNYIYDEKDELIKVEFFNRFVCGTPNVDSNGTITSITVTANNEKKYTVPFEYDDRGNIIKIVIPFNLMPSSDDDDITDETVIMEFIYDDENRMTQSSVTYITEDTDYIQHEFYTIFGFYDKEIVEYFYNDNGQLERTVGHSADQNKFGETAWWYSETQYSYDSDGKLIESNKDSHQIFQKAVPNETLEEIKAKAKYLNDICEKLFKAEGLVLSESWDYVEKLGEYLQETTVTWKTEFIYGDIYIIN